jgi:hypothetical protein
MENSRWGVVYARGGEVTGKPLSQKTGRKALACTTWVRRWSGEAMALEEAEPVTRECGERFG